MKKKKKQQNWEDLSTTNKTVTVVSGVVQVALAVSAWVDLARRPAETVRGPKGVWAVVIAINFVGPIAYFVRGRRQQDVVLIPVVATPQPEL